MTSNELKLKYMAECGRYATIGYLVWLEKKYLELLEKQETKPPITESTSDVISHIFELPGNHL
jgi:hypothetical protein